MNIEALRDEFAIAALNGMLAGGRAYRLSETDIAVSAYRYADAMLFQRNAYCPACGAKFDVTKGFVVHVSGCTYGWTADLPTGEGL